MNICLAGFKAWRCRFEIWSASQGYERTHIQGEGVKMCAERSRVQCGYMDCFGNEEYGYFFLCISSVFMQ